MDAFNPKLEPKNKTNNMMTKVWYNWHPHPHSKSICRAVEGDKKPNPGRFIVIFGSICSRLSNRWFPYAYRTIQMKCFIRRPSLEPWILNCSLVLKDVLTSSVHGSNISLEKRDYWNGKVLVYLQRIGGKQLVNCGNVLLHSYYDV